MKIIIALITLLTYSTSFALEVDEKLTLRLLKVSKTRKTILINRGIEDGLKEADHAKFFLSKGVVGRGVVIKVSPTRSVWSLYRLVDANEITKDKVMKLKITPPVKISSDETKTIVKDDTPVVISDDPRDLGIPLAEGAEDITDKEAALLKAGKNSMDLDILDRSVVDRNIEVSVGLQLSQMNSTTTPSSGTAFSSDEIQRLISVMGEYYFEPSESWYSRFSLMARLDSTYYSVMAGQGAQVTENSLEYGVGAAYHPFAKTNEAHTMVPFVSFVYSMGRSSATYRPGNEAAGANSENLSASITSYAIGGGVKYFVSDGWSARLYGDYYQRADKYGADPSNIEWLKKRSGFRMQLALGRRF